VVKGVPAEVCENCGEYYLHEPTARRVAGMAEAAERSGAEIEARKMAA
jgi:hypothetical protein